MLIWKVPLKVSGDTFVLTAAFVILYVSALDWCLLEINMWVTLIFVLFSKVTFSELNR